MKNHWNVLTLAVTPTLQIAGAYSAGDVLGGVQIAGAEQIGRDAWLQSVLIRDSNNLKSALTLYFFQGAPSSILDDAVFNTGVTYADQDKFRGSIVTSSSTWSTWNAGGSATAIIPLSGKDRYSNEYICYRKSAGDLRFYIVDGTGTTFTSADALKITLTLWME